MKTEDIVCPYSKCGREFKQPVMVTDYSKLPRETYYACPHCMLRLQLLQDTNGKNNLGHIRVEAVDDGTLTSQLEVRGNKFGEGVSSSQATRPSKSCRHFLGYLQSIPFGSDTPDECAVCPMIVQCYVKRE